MGKKKISRLLTALATVITLLLSQVVVAGYECQRDAPMVKDMASMADCMTKQTPAPCKPHCEKNSQIGSSGVSLTPPAFSLLIWVDLSVNTINPPQHTNMNWYAVFDPPIVFASQPLRIQYQVFRI